MFTVLMILTVLTGIFMVIVILMQSSKGQGLSGAFGGAGGVGTLIGVRHAADVLSKTTWILAGVFVLLIFVVNLFFVSSLGQQEQSIIQQGVGTPPAQQQQAPQQQAPQQQAPQQQQAPAPGQ